MFDWLVYLIYDANLTQSYFYLIGSIYFTIKLFRLFTGSGISTSSLREENNNTTKVTGETIDKMFGMFGKMLDTQAPNKIE
ncbi:MAG: hypothetical protein GY751_11065 [Bacteroidetes bacterium]|nr:hypothetical protein [Bacteroidota bacterium]